MKNYILADEEIEEQFEKLLERFDDNQFWEYVRSWKD